jgi:GAF domain-containing protein
MTDWTTALRNLIAAQPDPHLLRRVCQAAARSLPASGTGISVLTDDGVRGVYAASDARAERIEELQFVLGEGPCIDAFESRRPVLVSDLAGEAMTRWPMYAPAAHEGGVRGVFAFPMQMGAARLGVLDIFREHPGALTDDQLDKALIFADLTMEALLDRQEIAGADDGPALAVDHRAEVFQAQGMVMVQIGGTIREAMARMRAYAYAESRGLGDVAHDVVTGRLRFDRDQASS